MTSLGEVWLYSAVGKKSTHYCSPRKNLNFAETDKKNDPLGILSDFAIPPGISTNFTLPTGIFPQQRGLQFFSGKAQYEGINV